MTDRSKSRLTRRVNVNFSEETFETLESLARERGTTMAEVLRDAVALEQWIDQVHKDKDSRLLVERDGERREIVFRRHLGDLQDRSRLKVF